MKKTLWIVAVALCAALVAGCLLLTQGDLEEMSGLRLGAYAVLNRTKLENTEFVGQPSEEIWNESDCYSLENTEVLQKTPGKDFVILNLTDLHMTDFDYYGSYNVRLFSHIRTLVEQQEPDLITISGDLFSSCSVFWSVHQLADFLDSLGVPWAPLFGNHDDGGNCDLNYLADVMMESDLCLMRKGDPTMGVGNYIVNICQGEEIIHSLILMDSHGDGLHENQYAWYAWAAEGANAPSTVILHIPLSQYETAYDLAWNGQGWNEGFGAFGSRKEAICPERGSEGFFELVKAIGLTKNILCGHDHINDFSVLYEGVRLSYGLRLGVYGAHHPDNMGATLLSVDDNGKMELTHIHRYGE